MEGAEGWGFTNILLINNFDEIISSGLVFGNISERSQNQELIHFLFSGIDDQNLFPNQGHNGNNSKFDAQKSLSMFRKPMEFPTLTPTESPQVIKPQIVPTDYASPSKGQYLPSSTKNEKMVNVSK